MRVETKNIIFLMMIEAGIVWITLFFSTLVWKLYKDLQTSDDHWQTFLKSDLCEFCHWVLGCLVLGILIYIIYNFNSWAISHNLISLPNNKTTTSHYAGELIWIEFLLGCTGIVVIIVVIVSCFWIYEKCQETSVKMTQDLQKFKEDQELIRLKDIV
jgi:hypothetical protein